MPPGPLVGLRVGLRCPGWSCRCVSPSTLPPELTHLSFLPSHLYPGLERLRNLRHLDVAYNLLEGHRELSPLWLLAELRKVSLERFRDLGASCAPLPPSRADLVSALPHSGRPEAHLSLPFLLFSSTWRGTLCGSTLRIGRSLPSTCHPVSGMLQPA